MTAAPSFTSSPAIDVALRPYQTRAVERVEKLVSGGVRRILIVAPTGAGKTIVATRLITDAIAQDRCTLMLAHRRELIDQAYQKTIDTGLDPSMVGVVMASDRRRRPGAMVQVASVDTLRGWVGRRGMPLAHQVIIDEAHRAASLSYRRIVEAYPDATILGLTATPWRLDGKGLGDLFDELVVVSTIRELVDSSFLVPVRAFSHPRKPDLSDVRVRAGEFAEEDIVRVMRSSVLLGSVPEHYLARAAGRAAFGFACNVEHAHELANVCNEAGIPSVAISGETSPDERAKALRDLRSGAVKILWNCQLFTEGTDVPEVKAVILARPTLSRALAFQMIGRAMRPCPSTGFADCVVLDHAGVLPIHGHPHDPQDYTLTPSRPKRSAAPQTKCCPECHEELSVGATSCPCGHVWEREVRNAPSQVDGALTEYAAKPAVICSAQSEEQLCLAALNKALDKGAKSPIPYARAILERQLRRAPDKAIFERVVLSVMRPRPVAAAPSTMPAWLKVGLGIPVVPEVTREPDPPPAFVPFESSEEIVEVTF